MARSSSGSNWNIVELQRILTDRKKQLDKLMKRRDKAQSRLDAIDAEIQKVSGGVGLPDGRGGGAGGTRARNDRPLPDFIEEVLAKNGKPMKVGEIVDAVQAAGYRSNSKSFKNIVNQQLIKERDRFKQVDRGVYGLTKK